MDRDGHMSLEAAGLHFEHRVFEQLNRAVEKWLGHLGRGGSSKAGAASSAGVAVESELADN